MIPNHSPWIKQLNRTRPVVPLAEDIATDVAIVGGGIAGVVSAYFILRDTPHNVLLLEADMIAHGATGHNAGQLTSYFERPLRDLVQEFGLELAIDGQRAVESAWLLIDEIITETELRSPLYRFTGYAGCSTLQQLMAHLEDNRLRLKGGLPTETVLVAKDAQELPRIPSTYRDLYQLVPKEDILALLETNNEDYFALLSYQKGCMNSALFVEELVGYLIAKHKGRFSFFEASPMKMVTLYESQAKLEVLEHTVTSARVLLCTNGFENFSIVNTTGTEINTSFHHTVSGRIGYMAGYVEPLMSSPTAISYFPRADAPGGDPTGESYFYMTRRPHEKQGGETHNLICMGGPEKVLPNQAIYSKEAACLDEAREVIDEFLAHNYKNYPEGGSEYAFCWHGLMGYTPNGVRRVGVEPCNPVLLYNLGCNGVGILPSIYGGKRIADILGGKKIETSIFDPHDQRCLVSPASVPRADAATKETAAEATPA